MEEEEEDDIYAPDESSFTGHGSAGHNGLNGQDSGKKGAGVALQDEESGEEIEEDDSDSVRYLSSCVRLHN